MMQTGLEGHGFDHGRIATTISETLSVARLKDFKCDFPPEGPNTLTCFANGTSITVIFTDEPYEKDFLTVSQVEINQAKGAALIYTADVDHPDFRTQIMGMGVVNYYNNLAVAAATKGLAFLQTAFNKHSDNYPEIHLLDLETGLLKSGQRYMQGKMIIEDITLKTKGAYNIRFTEAGEFVVEKTAGEIGGDREAEPETVTIEFGMVEDADPGLDICVRNKPVIATCVSVDQYGIRGEGSGAKMFFSALQAWPELISAPALKLSDLVKNIKEAAEEAWYTEGILEQQETLKKAIFFHIMDQEPEAPGSFSEGDLVLHAVPALNPGINFQIFKVSDVAPPDFSDNSEYEAEIIIETEEGQKSYKKEIPDRETFNRKEINPGLSEYDRGPLDLILDHRLKLTSPLAGFTEGTTTTSRIATMVGARLPGFDQHSASVKEGIFSWERIVSNPVTLNVIKKGEFSDPIAKLPEDSEVISGFSQTTQASYERKVEQVIRGEFKVPGYWRVSKDLADLIISYQEALTRCTDADIVALGLEEKS